MNDISTYNGWTNRETWLVSLWLNNDPASYDLLNGQQASWKCILEVRVA